MHTSTLFNILLLVGVFLAAGCQALEDESLHEVQDEKEQETQDQELQDLQDANQDENAQELQDEVRDDSLQNADEDADADSDEGAQESQDEQASSDGRQTYVRTVISRCFASSTTVTCPTTYRYRLSCGLKNVARSGSYTRRRSAYPYLSRSCRCYAVRGYCTAMCTNQPVTMRIISSLKTTSGTRRVYCPTGYKVLGCHGRPLTASDTYASHYPVSYSSSSSYYGRVCACYSRYRYNCVASCGRIGTSSSGCPGSSSHSIRTRYGRGLVTATCSTGSRVLGCGISPRTTSREAYRAYYPYTSRSCRCVDYGYATCYALCG